MDTESNQAARLWRVYKTVHEMVSDRGYLISKQELEMPLDEFKQLFSSGGMVERQKLTFMVNHSTDPNDHLLVYFTTDESVGKDATRKVLQRMLEQSIKKGIIIYQKSMTPSATKLVQMASNYQLDLFKESELLVNITKHILVPPHEVLSTEAKKSLLIRYRLKETQLPRIQASDPIARYLGLKRGQVVKITRPSETAGQYVTYRYCF